ncbi:RNA-directed RNA polymerase [ssRNA phage Gerhypos.1_26]|uniref:RNA-directed RNA polymerase n=2 Tax=Leviviricetes TaxID=2842243 RepID=A0A8S5L2L5_9VIRU|nr:RNA-directed RNA polymerase [ssRNA phage Gerhypos.1_26]QDH89028.1 MAG: RNA-dependent RNA polymerase [Leviviridae sp.]DAD51872.1 TPA_asm: RNA-directed RNA polymerase [ssRNA phage Gerhypos.1_26]
MSKGSVFDFLGLYRSILKDISVYFPDDQKEWDRDLSRLISLDRTRGISTFTMDLPALGKLLDKGLSEGRLELGGAAHSGPRYPNTIGPRLFWGLWSRLFDSSGCLIANIDPNVVLFLRTLLYVGKNYESECAPRYLYEAVKEFFDVEEDLPPPSSLWDGDGSNDIICSHVHLRDLVGDSSCQPLLFFGTGATDSSMLDTIQRTADIVSSSFGILNTEEMKFRHGPGAVSDLSRGEYKYSFPNWPPRLEALFPYDMAGSTSLEIGYTDAHVGAGPGSYEPASVLIDVPKTMKGPRLIAKEPTAHQWIQQGVSDFLRQRVQRSYVGISIDFNSQEPSRDAALRASIDNDTITMDLKSASDRLSCAVVERLFRRNPTVLSAMIACRTRYIRNTIDKKSMGLLKLRKFSTQGSALTFPVQSICFYMFCVGVGKHLHPTWSMERLSRQVRIFGDDIIIPKSWEPLVTLSLETMFLRVNQTKTHRNGNFRESCGMDAWRGHDVTPPHILSMPIESEPRSIASCIAVTNNLFLKGFWHAAAWLESRVPQKILKRIPVVARSSGVFGLQSFSGGGIRKGFKTRWNESLQRDETRVLSVIAKSRVMSTGAATNLLQYFTEEPPPYIKYESGCVVAGVPVIRDLWVPSAILA